jgi:hypothetical protein
MFFHLQHLLFQHLVFRLLVHLWIPCRLHLLLDQFYLLLETIHHILSLLFSFLDKLSVLAVLLVDFVLERTAQIFQKLQLCSIFLILRFFYFIS